MFEIWARVCVKEHSIPLINFQTDIFYGLPHTYFFDICVYFFTCTPTSSDSWLHLRLCVSRFIHSFFLIHEILQFNLGKCSGTSDSGLRQSGNEFEAARCRADSWPAAVQREPGETPGHIFNFCEHYLHNKLTRTRKNNGLLPRLFVQSRRKEIPLSLRHRLDSIRDNETKVIWNNLFFLLLM